MKKASYFPPLKSLRLRHVVVDVFLMGASLWLSLYLRLGGGVFLYTDNFLFYLPIFIFVRLVFFYLLNIYNFIWRYVSARDAFRLAKAVGISSVFLLSISFLISGRFGFLPRTVYFIDALLLLILMMGARLLRRLLYEAHQDAGTENRGRRVIVYGAGVVGKNLATQLKSPGSGFELLGFLDDDKEKHGLNLDGMRVWGGIEALETLLEEMQVNEVFLAGPMDPKVLREIVQITSRKNIRPQVVKGVSSSAVDTTIRRISLGDLLNREPVQVDATPLRELFQGKKVLITGAGGSIGSEITRQVLGFDPGRLLILDHSEFNLFEIDREVRISSQNFDKVVPLLVDVKDTASLTSIFKKYSPDIVIHAAAYKHVHLVEANPYSAILNNIEGTKNLLDLCLVHDVQNFILISTDKAVNPVGVMGATKRVCELLTTLASVRSGKSYCSVRFGNVLGSSGSLIPTLQKQIQAGGPVTVTHKDMTRFFMLIPEAVLLVLKAATISSPGDINILKMGDSVKILDIAKNLIALHGKTEEEIPIVFTGTRPGEKLFEELYIRGDELKTEHPDILTLPNGDSELNLHNPNEFKKLEAKIAEMIAAAHKSDEQALKGLNDLIKSNLAIGGTLNRV